MRFIVTTLVLVFALGLSHDGLAQLGKKKDKEVFIQAPTFRKDPETKEVIYKGTINATGTQEELYNKFYGWFKNYYTNPSRLIKKSGVEEGILIVKPTMRIQGIDKKTGTETYDGQVIYTFEIVAKDNQVSYLITKIHHKKQSYYGIENWIEENDKAYHEMFSRYLVQVDENIQNAIKGMKDSLKN